MTCRCAARLPYTTTQVASQRPPPLPTDLGTNCLSSKASSAHLPFDVESEAELVQARPLPGEARTQKGPPLASGQGGRCWGAVRAPRSSSSLHLSLDGGAGDACSGGSGPSTGITRSRAAAPDTSPREQRENAAACEQTAAAARRGSSDAGEDRHREGGGLCCHHGTRTVTEIDRRHGFPVQVARPAVLVLVMIVALPYSSEHRGGARAS